MIHSGIDVTTIAGTASRSDLQIPGDVVAETLVDPPVNARARIALDAGFFGAFPGGVGTVRCALDFRELTGAADTVDAPLVAMVDAVRFSPIDFSFPHPTGSGLRSGLQCSSSDRVPVPLVDGGFEATDAGLLFAFRGARARIVEAFSLDGGVVSNPRTGPPLSIQVDGRGSAALISQSPTVSWSPPAVLAGGPTRYSVVVRRISRAGTSFLRTNIASLYTESTQVKVPPDLLVRGERYSFEVLAIQSANLDPRWPWLMTLPLSYGADLSAVFVAQ